MAILRVLTGEGDYATSFTDTSHDEAERLFKKLQSTYTAFRVPNDDGAKARRIDSFDPNADEIVMVPRIVGG